MVTEPGQSDGSRPQRLGHYELLHLIGSGGMGSVYLARDLRTGERVALKLIHPHLETDPTFIERFRREAQLASLLSSPYVVRVREFGYEEGRHFLVSEYVDGTTLRNLLGQGRLKVAEALSVVAQVATALNEAWMRGIVHRDIKPENIMIAADQTVKVADFGIAHLDYVSGLTAPGGFTGTVSYAAPEQFRGEGDIRSDIYALGVVLFEMLVGELPFQAISIASLMRQHELEPPPLDKLRDVRPAVVELVQRCLEKDPARRFQRPVDLLSAIADARRAESVPASARPSDSTAVSLPSGATVVEQRSAPSRTPTPAGPSREPPAPPRPAPRRVFNLNRLTLVSLVALLAVSAVATALFFTRGSETGSKVVPTQAIAPTSAPAVSPTVPVTPGPPPKSFSTGIWSFEYTLVAATCPEDQADVGTMTWSTTMTFKRPKSTTYGDDYIADGEAASAYDNDGSYIGDYVLRWPVLSFTTEISGEPGYMWHYMEFFDAHTGWGRRDEHFITPQGECVLVFEEPRPPGFAPKGPLP